jgi:hypothetical protein
VSRPVGPVGSSGGPGVTPGVPDAHDADRRTGDRRARERRSPSRRRAKPEAEGETGVEAGPGRALVPVGDRRDHDPAPGAKPRPAASARADAAFAAQLIGQDGQKRGLKGGAPVLNAARSTYLGAEYTGEKERRPPAGSKTKTEL